MFLHEPVGNEVRPMVTDLAPEGYFGRKRPIDDLRLHGTARVKRAPVPLGHAAWGNFDTTAERPLVGTMLLTDHVEVVGLEGFRQFDVDLTFVCRDQFFPAGLASVGG